MSFNPIITKITNTESMMETSSYDDTVNAINKLSSAAKIAELTGTKHDKFEDRLKFHEVYLNSETNEYNVQIKDTQENKEKEYIEYVLYHKQSSRGWNYWENNIYYSPLTNIYQTAKIIYNDLIALRTRFGWYPCDIKCIGLNDKYAYVFDIAYVHKKTKNLYNIDRFNINLYTENNSVVTRHEIKTLEHEIKKIITKNLQLAINKYPELWVKWLKNPVNTDIISMRNRYIKYMENIYKKDSIKMEKITIADIGKGEHVKLQACKCFNEHTLRQIANRINIDEFITIPRSSRGMVSIIPDEQSNPFTNKPTVTLYMNTKENIDNLLCEYIDILRGFSIITFMKSRQYMHRVKPYYDTTYLDYKSDLVSVNKNNNNAVLTFEITYTK